MHRPFRYLPLAFVLLLVPVAASSQTPIRLTVDASRAPLKVVSVHMVLPVAPGPLTLYYPKWIPGEHRPDGPIANLAGLRVAAHGSAIPWRRDPLDVFTFHLTVPAGEHQLDIRFQYLEPSLAIGQLSGGAAATDKLIVVNWNQFLLYPGGTPAQRLIYDPVLLLPSGWNFGTALPVVSRSGNRIAFSPVTLNRLVDSPLIAGAYYEAVNLTPPGEPIHHEIDMVADNPSDLAMSPQVQQGLTRLVAEAGALFGTRHYRDYHFLLTLSDHVPHFGLEHHESDDSRVAADTLLGPNASITVGALLAHEFVHSWNGKFRRPADLSPPYYEASMKADMLWAYEGITNYLGYVLATRSGLWSDRQYRRFLAATAAQMGPGRPGRTWRPLVDTGAALPGDSGVPGWVNWTRGLDFHLEGDLLWLEVATIIDRQSHGTRSFDDFCKLFYAGPNRGPQLRTYTFVDLVKSLNEIAPYDWAAFLRQHVDAVSPEPPLGGIAASGWRLIYNDQPPRSTATAASAGVTALYSIGLQVAPDGSVTASLWDSPAFRAGVSPGMRIAAVDGRTYTPQRLRAAIDASPDHPAPIELLVVNDDDFRTCAIDYHGGARYPHLVREADRPDYLDSEILRPRAPRK